MDGDAIIACISVCGYHILLAKMEVIMYLCHKGDVRYCEIYRCAYTMNRYYVTVQACSHALSTNLTVSHTKKMYLYVYIHWLSDKV